MNCADLEVLLRAHRLGQHLVGGVADQRVLERQLRLAGKRASLADDDEVLLAQRPQRLLQIPALGLHDRRQRALPERSPHDGRVRQQPTLEGLERVQPRRQQRLHRRRQLGRAGSLLLGQAAHHLLGEQRVALGPRRDRGDHALARLVDRQQRGDQLARVVLAERLEEDSRGVAAHAAPAGAPLEQLFPGEADLQHRGPHPLHEMLDQVEHSLIGPVDVLPDQHQRPLARQAFDARSAPRRRTLRAPAGRRAPPKATARSGASIPSRRPISAILEGEASPPSRSGSSNSSSSRAESFAHAVAGGSPSTIPHSARITSPSGQ